MTIFVKSKRKNLFYRVLSLLIAINFFIGSVCSSYVSAQILPANFSNITLETGITFTPAMIKGINIYPDNPLKFDFMIDRGDTNLSADEFKIESMKLIKYFLASLTVPEDQTWVNLSPYEKNRIIPNEFGSTDMGQEMLAQDFLLKQLTASLLNPDSEIGKKFWERVYQKTQEKFGTTDIPVNTFNKVWILPEKAFVYEHDKGAFVVDSHLKVMLEEDYLAMDQNMNNPRNGIGIDPNKIEKMDVTSTQIIREVLIPEIEREVNEGKTFANLRQIFSSMILATWYKQALKESILGKAYADQNKIKGIESSDSDVKEKIYNQYVAAFKKGAYDAIKEDYDPTTQQVVSRKYVTGGVTAARLKEKVSGQKANATKLSADQKIARDNAMNAFHGDDVTWQIGEKVSSEKSPDAAMMARHEQTHKPQLLAYLSQHADQIRALVDQYDRAKKDNPDELPKIEKQINAIVDQVNVDPKLAEQMDRDELEGALPFTLNEFQNIADGAVYKRYVARVQEMILKGDYVPHFLFAGKATRFKRGAMYSIDLWDVAVEMGLVKPNERSEYSFGMGQRQLIAYRLFLEDLAKKSGEDIQDVLARQQFVMTINDEVQDDVLNDMREQNFYGFNPDNIIFYNQPEYEGYRLDAEGNLEQVKGSAPLVYGHGDLTTQLKDTNQGFKLTRDGKIIRLENPVLSYLGHKLIRTHRINDAVKFVKDQKSGMQSSVVDVDKVAMGLYLLEERGKDYILELVANPLKSKGGTGIQNKKTGKKALVETLAVKGNPKLNGLVNELGEQEAPYNAFRNLAWTDRLLDVLNSNDLRYYLRWKDGYFYLEGVTGDISLMDGVNAETIQREGEVIQDIKENAQVPIALSYLREQDNDLRDRGISPEGFRGDSAMLVHDLRQVSLGLMNASPFSHPDENRELLSQLVMSNVNYDEMLAFFDKGSDYKRDAIEKRLVSTGAIIVTNGPVRLSGKLIEDSVGYNRVPEFFTELVRPIIGSLSEDEMTDFYRQFERFISAKMDGPKFIADLAKATNNSEKTVVEFLKSQHLFPLAVFQWNQANGLPTDAAMNAQENITNGGIDFNPKALEMNIKRDGKGVPLPISQQPIEQFMRLQEFVPVIINVVPIQNLPALLGLKEENDEVQLSKG